MLKGKRAAGRSVSWDFTKKALLTRARKISWFGSSFIRAFFNLKKPGVPVPCIPTSETEMESPSFSEYMRIGKSSGIICMRGHFSRCWRSIGQVQTWNNVRRVGCVSPHHAASGGWEELTQPSVCLYFHVCLCRMVCFSVLSYPLGCTLGMLTSPLATNPNRSTCPNAQIFIAKNPV